MKPDEASRTAEYMALFRAIESARGPTKRLFNDPFAVNFLRPSLRLVARFSSLPLIGAMVPYLIDTRWLAGARPVGVARTRFIDKRLAQALEEGTKQVVVLGAGYDTRAYRIEGIDRAQVFEIDHPNTSKSKRQSIERQLGSLPRHVHFIPLDFNAQSLQTELKETSFDGSLKTVFIWEGVTNYLTAESVDKCFRDIRSIARDCCVIFTYVDIAVIDGSREFEDAARLKQVLAAAGEQWTFGFDPSTLEAYLANRGLLLVEDLGSVEFRSRFLETNRHNMRGYQFYRVAVANSVVNELRPTHG